MMDEAKTDLLFEASYEVCNKVGGIYTVLLSKAAIMMEKYPQYIMIGPYYEEKANVSMQQLPAPQALADVFRDRKSVV